MKRRFILWLLPFALTACNAEVIPPKETTAASSVASSPAPDRNALTQTYTNTAEGYSIKYPEGWTVEEHARSPLTYRQRAGTAIITPENFAKGTTFLSGLLFIETSYAPCARFVNAKTITLGDKKFYKGTSTTVGSRQEQRYIAYGTSKDKRCYNLMLSLRLCKQGTACGQDHLNSFDSQILYPVVERMMESFKIL